MALLFHFLFHTPVCYMERVFSPHVTNFCFVGFVFHGFGFVPVRHFHCGRVGRPQDALGAPQTAHEAPKSTQDGPKKTRKKEQQARLECFRLKGLWLHEILQLALYRSLAARLVFHPLPLTKRTNEKSDPMCPMGPMWELFNIEIVAHPLVPIPILECIPCSP